MEVLVYLLAASFWLQSVWTVGVSGAGEAIDLVAYDPDSPNLAAVVERVKIVRQMLIQQQGNRTIRIRPMVRWHDLQKYCTTPGARGYVWIAPSRLPEQARQWPLRPLSLPALTRIPLQRILLGRAVSASTKQDSSAPFGSQIAVAGLGKGSVGIARLLPGVTEAQFAGPQLKVRDGGSAVRAVAYGVANKAVVTHRVLEQFRKKYPKLSNGFRLLARSSALPGPSLYLLGTLAPKPRLVAMKSNPAALPTKSPSPTPSKSPEPRPVIPVATPQRIVAVRPNTRPETVSPAVRPTPQDPVPSKVATPRRVAVIPSPPDTAPRKKNENGSAPVERRQAVPRQTVPRQTRAQLKKRIARLPRQIYFSLNSSTLSVKYQRRLRVVASFLKKHRRLRLSLEGWTDLTGSLKYNLYLSKKRAQAVKRFLQRQGIASRRISIQGRGVYRPKNSRKNNPLFRRTDLKISF